MLFSLYSDSYSLCYSCTHNNSDKSFSGLKTLRKDFQVYSSTVLQLPVSFEPWRWRLYDKYITYIGHFLPFVSYGSFPVRPVSHGYAKKGAWWHENLLDSINAIKTILWGQ